MPCYTPLQAYFVKLSDGSRKATFPKSLQVAFRRGELDKAKALFDCSDDFFSSLPCGQCQGCRLERSRQWAVRCMHELQLHTKSSFVTLTYSPENLPEGGTLVKSHFQDFMKRLRYYYPATEFDDLGAVDGVRYYMCGEYGDRFKRPHYHAILYGVDFADKRLWKVSNRERLYVSDELSKIWDLGFSSIGDVTFESCAYVARYIMKKVNGKAAEAYYGGRVPEYNAMSRSPGIARRWYRQFRTDVYPKGYFVLNGVKCKPPRYYDTLFSNLFPLEFEKIKNSRLEEIKRKAADNTYERLQSRLSCLKSKLLKLVRNIE